VAAPEAGLLFSTGGHRNRRPVADLNNGRLDASKKRAASEEIGCTKFEMNMKKKIILLLAVVMAAGTTLAPKTEAIDFSISIGDRPFYYGPNYWHQGYQWVWIPGYRHRGHWIHGHYVRRGRWHRAYARYHYRHHHHHY
jgi:hypothetical protein